MMLGEVLQRLSQMSDDEIALIVAHDIVRLARLRAAADAQAQPLADYVRGAVFRFLERGSEEDWATAMGRMQSAPAPGDQLIALAIEQQLRRDEQA